MENHFLFLGNVATHLVALVSGLASFCIAVWQAYKKHPISERVFWVIGGFCLLAAFDSAWQDEHRNTQVVIAEKSVESGLANTCLQDERVTQAYRLGLEGDNRSLQRTLDSQQNQLNNQQGTLNSCVVSLGKVNVPPPFHLEVHQHHLTSKSLSQGLKGVVLVANINRRLSSFNGSISCSQDFTVISASLTSGNFTLDAADYHSVDKNAPLDFDVWEPSEPLVVILVAKNDGQLNCAITKKQ